MLKIHGSNQLPINAQKYIINMNVKWKALTAEIERKEREI